MAKDDVLTFEGEVIEVLPNAMFRVQVKEDYIPLCVISGRMRQNRIQILLGDQVKLEVSTYDLSRGRITYRSR